MRKKPGDHHLLDRVFNHLLDRFFQRTLHDYYKNKQTKKDRAGNAWAEIAFGTFDSKVGGAESKQDVNETLSHKAVDVSKSFFSVTKQQTSKYLPSNGHSRTSKEGSSAPLTRAPSQHVVIDCRLGNSVGVARR